MFSQFARGFLAMGLLGVSQACASTIIDDAGLSNSQFHVTFDEVVLPQGTVVTNQFGPFGVTFSTVTLPEYPTSDLRYDVQGQGATFHGIMGHYIGSTGANPVSIEFTEPVSAATFGMASNPRAFTVSALLGGVEIESFSFFSSGGENPQVNGQLAGFYGFQDITFDEIEIFGILSNPTDNRVLLDNIQFNAVPEPAAGVMVVAFALVHTARRRRR